MFCCFTIQAGAGKVERKQTMYICAIISLLNHESPQRSVSSSYRNDRVLVSCGQALKLERKEEQVFTDR